uniref:Putative terminase n=1 Tax=viral metagenome TaxID=1070528 RepID=A0A6M3IQA5_9ZZZZ
MRTMEEILEGEELSEFLIKCSGDFKFFCERVLGITEYGGIHDYMIEWVKLVNRNERVIIRAPSGFAKTTILGVAYPLWWAFTKSNQKILLISRTISQSKDALLYQIKDYIEDNELLRELIPKDVEKTWNQTQLKTTNKNTIINRPYAISIKGYRADIIICDEIDSYDDPDIFFDHVLSRVNPGGKIIGITTPEGPTKLVGLIEDRDLGKNEYIIRTYPAIIDCKIKGDLSTGKSIWSERFSIDELMSRRSQQGEQKWQKNYMCNVMAEEENAIFKAKHVQSCKDFNRKFTTEKYNKTSQVYIGCDFAIASGPTADFDVYVVVEKVDDLAIIKFAEIHKGLPPSEKVRRIENLYELHKPVMIICDESNIGGAIIPQLRAKGLPVEAQSFQSKARTQILNNLKVLIDNKRLIIPKHPEDLEAIKFSNTLEYELICFQEVKTKYLLSYQSKAAHDDTVMALAMAVKRIKIHDNFQDYISVRGDLEDLRFGINKNI